MIPKIIAGFYCDQTKLAENAAFNRNLLTILVITFVILAPIGGLLIWNTRGSSFKVKVITELCIGFVVLLILAGFWAYGFANTPHWC